MPGSIRVARFLGIDLRIHVSWLLIFGLVLFTLAESVFPATYPFWSDEKTLVVAVVAALLFFASVVAHELAHALVARRFRMEVSSITLFLLGGVANLTKEPTSARAEFLMAFAGPATSFALGGLGLLIESVADAPGLQPVAAVAGYLGMVNIALALFNLVPGFPLDGGRVLRSIVWGIRGDRAAATRIAARGGQLVAALLVAGGAYFIYSDRGGVSGLWYFLIAYFLYNAASAALAQERAAEAVGSAHVAQLLGAELHAVGPATVVGALVRDVVLPFELRAVPVIAGGRLVGIVTIADLQRVDHESWPATAVSAVMRDATELAALAPADPLSRALEVFSETDAPLLPVVEGGVVVGVLTRDALAGYVQMREALGMGGRSA
ncbi:MAG: site-2 protease family protein [Candidatus Limnocylindria bacterium]|nr:site-2 protease family protein [Candidatus Limnocylindria bacterium]